MNQALVETCLLYLDGDLAADELQAFNKLLVESTEAADLLAQLSLDEQHYRATPAETQDDLLPELLKLEATAQPLSHDAMVADVAFDSAERSANDYRSTLTILSDSGFWGYLAGSALRSKPVRWAGVAAVLLLAATLVFVFASGPSDTPPSPELAGPSIEQGPNRSVPTPPSTATVATLTAEQNASWAEGALAPGSQLRAGQRFTLTQGVAEITTNRGAIAILQAPATIELLDSDNALRLHSGKLVGICETQSSKGLLVRTPYMDVVDLGTRFGVEVLPYRWTEVHVHQGEVVVQHQLTDATTSEGQSVLANQAVRLGSSSDALTAIKPVFEKFASALTTYRLRGTGFGLAEGAVDPHWQIVADANGPLASALPITVARSSKPHFPVSGNDPDKAQWLYGYPAGLEEGLDTEIDQSQLTFRSRFELPDAVKLDQAQLLLEYASRHGIQAMRINGQVIDLPTNIGNDPLDPASNHHAEFNARDTALRHGTNEIEVDLYNSAKNAAPTRFYLQWELRPMHPNKTPDQDAQPRG